VSSIRTRQESSGDGDARPTSAGTCGGQGRSWRGGRGRPPDRGRLLGTRQRSIDRLPPGRRRRVRPPARARQAVSDPAALPAGRPHPGPRPGHRHARGGLHARSAHGPARVPAVAERAAAGRRGLPPGRVRRAAGRPTCGDVAPRPDHARRARRRPVRGRRARARLAALPPARARRRRRPAGPGRRLGAARLVLPDPAVGGGRRLGSRSAHDEPGGDVVLAHRRLHGAPARACRDDRDRHRRAGRRRHMAGAGGARLRRRRRPLRDGDGHRPRAAAGARGRGRRGRDVAPPRVRGGRGGERPRRAGPPLRPLPVAVAPGRRPARPEGGRHRSTRR